MQLSRKRRTRILGSAGVCRALSIFVVVISIVAPNSDARCQNSTPSPVTQNETANQKQTEQSQDSSSTDTQPDQPKAKKEKRGSLVIAPIPISSPAFGSGLLLTAGYVFKLDQQDKTSPPSWLGATSAFTSNGTGAVIVGGRLYLKENKYQTTLALGKGRANLDFFGIARIPGRDAISVPLSMQGTIFFGELLRNVGRNIFIGPRYQYRRLSARIDGLVPPGGFEVPDIDRKSNSVALGFHLQRDRRDSTFYPTKGTLFDFTHFRLFRPGLGKPARIPNLQGRIQRVSPNHRSSGARLSGHGVLGERQRALL